MGIPPHRRGEPTARKSGRRVRVSLQGEHGGADEELEAHERRDRVAGKTEHERPPAYAEGQRLARLHGDAPEHLFDTELGRNTSNEIVRSNRDAAGSDEHVRFEPSQERSAMRLLVIGDGDDLLDRRPCARQSRREHDSVCLVDLSRSQRLAGWTQLRPGRDHRCARSAGTRHSAEPGGREGPDLGGPEPNPRIDDHFPRDDVAGARANARSGLNGRGDLDAVVLLDNVLDRDDGVGALGYDAARRDRHRLAGGQRARRGAAGGNMPHDRKRSGRVPGAEREAVHRRARKRRQVDCSTRGFGEDTSRRILQSERLRGDRPCPLEHGGQRLVNRE